MGYKVRLYLSVLMVFMSSFYCLADGGGGSVPVNRSESLAFKNSLRAFMDALGTPPASYEKEKETFQLPTEVYRPNENDGFNLSSAEASFVFKSGMTSEELGKEYQKKILAAQAKGDYEEIQKLSTEMSSKIMEVNNTETSRITVEININSNPSLTIDPESVLFEKPGCIAVFSETSEGNTEVTIALDPVILKETQTVSLINFYPHFESTYADKNTVKCAYIKMKGPSDVVKKWAGQMDVGKALAAVN